MVQTTKLPPAQVLKFPKMGRRTSISRLTKNYAPMLVHIMQASMLDDGTHVDDDDLPMCRKLDMSEMRLGATVTAAQFFLALLMVRAKFETPIDGAEDIHHFVHVAKKRVKDVFIDAFGEDGRLVIAGKYKRDLTSIERNYVGAVMTALKIEAKADPELDEVEFWADIFRAMGDGDPSGVILRAAGVVLLDHLPTFRHALAQHMENPLRDR